MRPASSPGLWFGREARWADAAGFLGLWNQLWPAIHEQQQNERLGEIAVYLPALACLGTNPYASRMPQSCLSQAVSLTLSTTTWGCL